MFVLDKDTERLDAAMTMVSELVDIRNKVTATIDAYDRYAFRGNIEVDPQELVVDFMDKLQNIVEDLDELALMGCAPFGYKLKQVKAHWVLGKEGDKEPDDGHVETRRVVLVPYLW